MKAVIRGEFVCTIDVVVEGRGPDEIQALAHQVLHESAGLRLPPGATMLRFEQWMAPDDARLSTYTCTHCGRQSLKDLWGPGRVTCPHCGKRA